MPTAREQKGGVITVDTLEPEQAEALKLIWVDQGYQGENESAGGRATLWGESGDGQAV